MTKKDPQGLKHWRHRSTWIRGRGVYLGGASPLTRYTGPGYQSHPRPGQKVWWGVSRCRLR